MALSPLNCSRSCNNSNVLNERKTCIKNQEGSYIFVDHGEQFVIDMEEGRLELQKQIVSLLEKVCLLWDIVRKSLIFVLPTLAGVVASLLTSQYFPDKLALWISSLIFSVTLGLVFINLHPLNEAIAKFLDHQMYFPTFKGSHSQRSNQAEKTEVDIANEMAEILLSSEQGSQGTKELELD